MRLTLTLDVFKYKRGWGYENINSRLTLTLNMKAIFQKQSIRIC